MALWTPGEITTALWLDASDSGTVFDTAGNVYQWNDKSGNLYHVAQGTSGSQPALISAEQNGLDVIRFNGTSHGLVRETDTSLFQNIGSGMIFAVRKATSAASRREIISLHDNFTDFVRGGLNVGQTANKSCATGRRLHTDSAQLVASASSVDTASFEIQSGSFDYTNSDLYVYVDGVLEGTNTSFQTAGNTENVVSTRLTVGYIATLFFQGDIAELIVVHGDISATTRQLIEGYLAHKWGLAGSLDAGHPYKSAAPTTGIEAVIADAYSPIDAILAKHGVAATITDTYHPTDAIVAQHGVSAIIADTYSPVDAIVAAHGEAFIAQIVDTYTPADAIVAKHGVAAVVADSYIPADVISAKHGVAAVVADAYAPNAAIVAVHSRAAVIADTYHPTDAIVAQHDNLFTGLETGFSNVIAPLRLTVRGLGNVSAPLRLTVSLPQGDVSAPLRLTVRGYGDVSAPLRLVVRGTSQRWRHQVLLAGVDVSARITGEVWDEQNEGAAHIAGFTLLPSSGSINPFSYVGAAVVINHIRRETTGDITQRRFTGKVHQPDYNPADGTITFTCTDDLQIRVSQMSRAALDTLTGGRYHRAVHGEPENNWEYAQALMSTIAADLDCQPSGAITVTPWQGLPVYQTYTLANTIDGSINVTLPQRTSLINRIDGTFEYRFNRLHRRTTNIRYSMDLHTAVNNALPLLSRSTVEAALESTGWEFFYDTGFGGGTSNIGFVASEVDPATPIIHYTPYPEIYEYPFSDAIWTQAEPDTTCLAFQCSMYKRWAQSVTETYSLTITAPESIAQNGILAREDSASLASSFDGGAWESDIKASPQLDSSDRFQTLDYAPDADTADRDNAIQTFVDMSKVTILDSHRTGRAGARILIDPKLDLTRAARIETVKLTAEGKVVYVRHSSNADAGAGYALTEFRIALSGHGATGLPTVTETASTAPAAPVPDAISDDIRNGFALSLGVHIGGLATSPAEDADWTGWIVNVQSSINITDPGALAYKINAETQKKEVVSQPYSGDHSNPNYVASKAYQNTGFRVAMPAVEDAARDNLEPAASKTYEIPIPENELALAA